jgi:hypothetical protein
MDVSHLQVDGGFHVRELTLPQDVTVNADPELLLAHVVLRAVEPEPVPEVEAEAPAQPEVIKAERKEKEKEE